eukprot:529353_1
MFVPSFTFFITPTTCSILKGTNTAMGYAIGSAASMDFSSLEVTYSCFIDNDSNAQATIGLTYDSEPLKNEGNYFGGNVVAQPANTGYYCPDGMLWKDSWGWPDRCIHGSESQCLLEE